MIEVEWISDEELLLRGLLFVGKEPKYVDKGVFTSMVFAARIERGECPSVHRGKSADLRALIDEEPTRYGFAVLLAYDIRAKQLGEVIHNPAEHDSHALIVPHPSIKSQNQIRRWRGLLTNLIWDIIVDRERTEQLQLGLSSSSDLVL